MRNLTIIGLLFFCINAMRATTPDQFDWRNASVYFVITDRFCNGDVDNDINYGRIVDYGSERLNAATFHGGDFAGMLKKAREGYFTNLGVDVVWMTDVYEQIHGWMSGSGSVNDFPHYGYHGYYPLDYTQIDKNYGTVDEFRELVDCLHSQGIRVMLGANLNDPGYPTLLDAVQYGFADTGLTMTFTKGDLAGRDGMTAAGFVCLMKDGMKTIRFRPRFTECPISRTRA